MDGNNDPDRLSNPSSQTARSQTTRSRATTSEPGSSKKRKRSGRVADLYLAEKRVGLVGFRGSISELPSDVTKLYKDLKLLCDGHEFLPTNIKVESYTKQIFEYS